MLKDDCFDGMPKPRADIEKEVRAEIALMADIASLVVNKGRLNLKDIRLPYPSLKQKHTLSNIIALRNEGIPINHNLSLEEFVEQSNKQLHIKHKERRPDKLLSIFRRVLSRMNLQLGTAEMFKVFKAPYSFADRRSPTRFNTILTA
jgi:hypothetical protein